MNKYILSLLFLGASTLYSMQELSQEEQLNNAIHDSNVALVKQLLSQEVNVNACKSLLNAIGRAKICRKIAKGADWRFSL